MKKRIALAVAAMVVLGIALTGCGTKKCAADDCSEKPFTGSEFCETHLIEEVTQEMLNNLTVEASEIAEDIQNGIQDVIDETGANVQDALENIPAEVQDVINGQVEVITDQVNNMSEEELAELARQAQEFADSFDVNVVAE